MQDMLGKVPNKANTPKKVLIRVSVVLGVMLLVSALVLAKWAYNDLRNGLDWEIPQEIIDKIDFSKLTDNIDEMLADGFTDTSSDDESRQTRNSYSMMYLDEGTYIAPMINVLWESETDGSLSKTSWLARTSINYLDSFCRKEDKFIQIAYIGKGNGKIWVSWCTPTLFDGRQLVVDCLNDFCDKYCAE